MSGFFHFTHVVVPVGYSLGWWLAPGAILMPVRKGRKEALTWQSKATEEVRNYTIAFLFQIP
jgi:hypothetical protein